MGDRKIFTPPSFVDGQFTTRCNGGNIQVTLRPERGKVYRVAYSNELVARGVGPPIRPITEARLTGTEAEIRARVFRCSACKDNSQGGCIFGKKT